MRTLFCEEEEKLCAYDDDEGRHNNWNDLLTCITDHATGYRIQQSLEDEEVVCQISCAQRCTNSVMVRVCENGSRFQQGLV